MPAASLRTGRCFDPEWMLWGASEDRSGCIRFSRKPAIRMSADSILTVRYRGGLMDGCGLRIQLIDATPNLERGPFTARPRKR